MPSYHNSPQRKFFSCHVCGEDVPVKALACPECGADKRTGLYGESADDHLLPDDGSDFSYDAFMEREFGNSPKPTGTRWLWWVTALILLVLFIWMELNR